ncbi:hypothetical protein A6C57_23530 [Fibrella sp. ES10-3-2-2]|nr:hypothetical protein A6C57_23530 [Fibrella sp. ES10-3-2-2]
MKHAKPLPVPEATGFYYELPVSTNTAQMKEYEAWARLSFENYVSRIGRRLFFNFKTPTDRNNFMSAMEKTLQQKGTIAKRTYLNQ